MPGFNDNEPIPVVGSSPYDDPTAGHRFNSDWSEILVGLLEFALWPDFWSGSQSQIDTALTHTHELIGILSGQSMRNMMIAKHKEDDGDSGGSSSAATWHKRRMNVVSGFGDFYNWEEDAVNLDPGDYWITGYCVGYIVGFHVARLTCEDTSQTQVGTVGWANSIAGGEDINTAVVEGLFTFTTTKSIQLDHYTQLGVATYGLGVAANIGVDEIYAVLRVLKLR